MIILSIVLIFSNTALGATLPKLGNTYTFNISNNSSNCYSCYRFSFGVLLSKTTKESDKRIKVL